MPQLLPELNLTLGQMLWALRHGEDPPQWFKDQARYLRLLGVPQGIAGTSPGSGNRLRYDFFDLVELGIALKALELRFRPKDIQAVLADDRDRFREAIRSAWLELPDAAVVQPWVKSRGKTLAMVGEDYFIRLHDRRSEKWGKLDLFAPTTLGRELAPITMQETLGDGQSFPIIQLKQSMLPWVAWALEAPEQRRGPM